MAPVRLAMLATAGAVGATLLVPGQAAAHAVDRGLLMLLPTGYYLAGAAAAVAASFVLLALSPGRLFAHAGAWLRVPLSAPPGLPLVGAMRWLAFAAFALLLAIGFAGPRDPADNLLVLTLWTLWWVGYTVLTAAVGDLWPLLNPWSAPVRLARRLLGPRFRPGPARIRLLHALGHWPAVAGLFAFAWFEIVDPAPSDPERLAAAAALYWTVHFAAMLLFGERRWRARGETFSVLFRLVARVSPFRWRRRGITLAPPGARLARGPALPLAGWIFVIGAIASVSFDGLSATFAWLAATGINPLEFPGRSAVVAENTIGLAAAWAALAAAYAGTVAAGHRLARSRAALSVALGRVGLSLVPIALAYHLAHYLSALAVDAQFALAALSDPFGTGADLLDLGGFHPGPGFAAGPAGVRTLWQVQTAAVVLGHVLAVIVAHAVALDLEAGDRRRAALGQLPIAALMVGLTILALWLLSTPTGA